MSASASEAISTCQQDKTDAARRGGGQRRKAGQRTFGAATRLVRRLPLQEFAEHAPVRRSERSADALLGRNEQTVGLVGRWWQCRERRQETHTKLGQQRGRHIGEALPRLGADPTAQRRVECLGSLQSARRDRLPLGWGERLYRHAMDALEVRLTPTEAERRHLGQRPLGEQKPAHENVVAQVRIPTRGQWRREARVVEVEVLRGDSHEQAHEFACVCGDPIQATSTAVHRRLRYKTELAMHTWHSSASCLWA